MLLEGNACAAARADGSTFYLAQEHVLSMGPAPSGKPVLIELSHLSGAVELEIGYRSACARFADGRVRCLAPGKGTAREGLGGDFTVPLGDGPASAVFFSNGDLACALMRSGGLQCREVKDGAYLEPVAPLARGSALPVRALPVE